LSDAGLILQNSNTKFAIFASYRAAPKWRSALCAMGTMEKLMPVDSLQKQEGRDAEGRFRKGQSGNPAGRSRGSRNKAIVAAEMLLEGEAEALTRRALERALEGDTAALRLCLDRIIPPRRGRAVRLDEVGPVCSAADLGHTMAAITTAATGGVITPGEAAELAQVIEIFVRAVETSDFERRLKQLEDRRGAGA
jgi:Family of unknown function (DUF5681)